ncbi:uncharacterized protein LOC110832171 [Zootermopsis nevadensis]|uniref:uncharacterized protein LOC110832171 n=1 Tax=Zootermopsis nevadensis TaxID=136037 RepID=UPI000B8E5FBB|nr:uncharacterized protein LOC110832171 [Zootermopsis nevadensis]XP_021924648.1 uncharacterized protein LOC110832171 [Zootermopsis nevadensis]XP_021924649.1 uncharacterized protein LOC110832171 [Zootermopsis nevadensis]
MAWLGGLSTLKGQITSFTKEVLSEGRDESHDTSLELAESKKKVQELEELCVSQNLEEDGVVMYSALAPDVADFCMDNFEHQALSAAPLKPTHWFSYIDNTFVAWSHGRDELEKFQLRFSSIQTSHSKWR